MASTPTIQVNKLPSLFQMSCLLALIMMIGFTEAASLANTKELSSLNFLSIVSTASCICLIVTIIVCLYCCKRGFAKFDEPKTNTDSVVCQNYTSFGVDFSPPTESTPNRPPGAPLEEPDVITIEPLPRLPGRISTQRGNVMRSGEELVSSDPIQTVQNIKLINSPRFQFPRNQINYVNDMGNGWFGKVLQGEAHRMHPGLRKTRVVIKQLRETASPEEQLLFLQEVQPYREVNHPNVLLLFAQCINNTPLLLILEYAPFGDLKSYLRKNSNKISELAQQDILLRMATDMISGLMWLHQADFIYIDLATRNCQVSADTSIKIGDYGLALEKYPDDYLITKDQAIPIRWLGPEVIDLSEDGTVKTKKITKQSNVWSFGIMMLELSTGARRPYAKLTDEQVLQQVVKEQEIRVDKPHLSISYASRWFEVMMYCWLEADIRLSMKELHELLKYLQSNRDRVEMPDFECRWNSLKPAALQESSDSSREDESSAPSQTHMIPLTQTHMIVPTQTPPQRQMMPPPAGGGFFEDVVHPPMTTKALQSYNTPAYPQDGNPPVSKNLQTEKFDSDFGSMVVVLSAQPTLSGNITTERNRNMNADTSQPIDSLSQISGNDVVLPGVQSTVKSIMLPTERLESDLVVQTALPSTLSVALEGATESNQSTEEMQSSGQYHADLFLVSQPENTSLKLPPDMTDNFGDTSTNLEDYSNTQSFLSSVSMNFNKGVSTPKEMSQSFHSVIDQENQHMSFVSNATLYETTPNRDQTYSVMVPLKDQVTLPLVNKSTLPPEDQITLPLEDRVTLPPEDRVTLPPEDRVTSPPEDRVTSPPEDRVTSPPEDRVTLPPEDRITLPLEDRVTSPPEDRVTSPPEDRVTSPPEDRVTSPPEDQISLPLEDRVTLPPENRVTSSPDD